MQVDIKKEAVQLDLVELESAAQSTLEEENAMKDSKAADALAKAVNNLKIQER